MKRRVAIFLSLLAVGAVAGACAVLGRRVPVPETAPTTMPQLAQLDGWLAAQEAEFADITPGAEKHVAWADPGAPARTGVAMVYLHGFSATRQEVSPLCEQVAAALGANLYLARLAGHGRPGEALAEATVAEWAADGREAVAIGHALGEKVVLVGTSTGGTLALWLASQGADVDGLVVISPNFWPQGFGAGLLLYPGRSFMAHALVGDEREWEPHNDAQARYWTYRYPVEALFPMMDLVGLLDQADLGEITAPTLAIYSPDDTVVREDLTAKRLPELGGPLRTVVVTDSTDPSQHVIAGDILSPNTTDRLAGEIERFVRDEVVGNTGQAAQRIVKSSG